VGHDRGARICHRLAVANPSPHFKILGSVFLDIVPTLIQWQTFSTPTTSIGSFHWPFLANVEFAVPIIMAQGGDVFIRTCLERWLGKGREARTNFEKDDAIAVYAEFFKKESVIRATCDDYRAGGKEDIEEQLSDQKEGRKIDGNVLSVYSAEYLGRRYDLKKVWSEWISGKGSLEVLGIGGGVGHFVAEEAPGGTASAIISFYDKHL
jgi:pimeloyl-ACP methyl ester carboxylesterase